MSQKLPEIIIFICSVGLLCVIFGIVMFLRGQRWERRMMKLNASEFNSITKASRKKMATRDLDDMYLVAKRAIYAATSKGQTRTFAILGKKVPEVYGEQFGKLFLKPFMDRMTNEGFDITYLPNGSMQMSRKQEEPAFDISWKNAEDDVFEDGLTTNE